MADSTPSVADRNAPAQAAIRHLPGPRIASWRRTARYWFTQIVIRALVNAWVRVRVEHRERLPRGPAVLCFTHLNWVDPFLIMSALPARPRLFIFGPKEQDMSVGGRNRLMWWSGFSVPYRPGKDDLLDATRAVRAIFASGGVLAIAGEGRIHRRESEVLPLSEGAAYFALRSGVPLVPVALNGSSWVRFGGRIRVAIGEPILPEGRPTRAAVADLTARTHAALTELVKDVPDVPEPGPLARWLTELFNDWPEGARPGLD
jgi:1-acyl-sn-glycerol-3-phosphate acyltransferase